MIKKIKHRTKMRRRIMNHSNYQASKIIKVWCWTEDNGYSYRQWSYRTFGRTKGREIGNVNTLL